LHSLLPLVEKSELVEMMLEERSAVRESHDHLAFYNTAHDEIVTFQQSSNVRNCCAVMDVLFHRLIAPLAPFAPAPPNSIGTTQRKGSNCRCRANGAASHKRTSTCQE